jgi:hypothetical protein
MSTATKVSTAKTRLAKMATALRAKSEATTTATNKVATTKKITHSYRLFSLLKKQKGTATTAQLAAATGLPPGYVAWYMAELKRVYGVKLEHKRGDKIWKAKGYSTITVPPAGIAGRRPGSNVVSISSLPRKEPIRSGAVVPASTMESVQEVINGMRAQLDKLSSQLPGLIAAGTAEVQLASIPVGVLAQMTKENAQARRQLLAK